MYIGYILSFLVFFTSKRNIFSSKDIFRTTRAVKVSVINILFKITITCIECIDWGSVLVFRFVIQEVIRCIDIRTSEKLVLGHRIYTSRSSYHSIYTLHQLHSAINLLLIGIQVVTLSTKQRISAGIPRQ